MLRSHAGLRCLSSEISFSCYLSTNLSFAFFGLPKTGRYSVTKQSCPADISFTEGPVHGFETMPVLCHTCERLVHAAISGSLAKHTWHDHHATIGSLVEAIDARCSICLIFRGKGLDVARHLAIKDPSSPTLLHFCENQEYPGCLPAGSLQFDVCLRIDEGQYTLTRRFLFILRKGRPRESIVCNLHVFLIFWDSDLLTSCRHPGFPEPP